eukprot:CAMPEP_0119549322 /NCGR_PEP_ID=MMETSP1352-20130426/3058_1 /TAXON_ID=265584 /ORGANISM="Stauroneis constricta, Strain CCMP1120" /LENGTH=396 /DNA_ID=CAMNT_0007594855 /DNA_START=133 /DNA_END=1323 /DNA_ORIENTATION=-
MHACTTPDFQPTSRQLKKSSSTSSISKASKATRPEAASDWRDNALTLMVDAILAIDNMPVVQQLADSQVIPDSLDASSAASGFLTALFGSNACDPSTDQTVWGFGVDGKHTDRICDLLNALVSFWSLDPAQGYPEGFVDNLDKVEGTGTKGDILSDADFVAARTPFTKEQVLGLQFAVENVLPGKYSNPLLSFGIQFNGFLFSDGLIKTLRDADGDGVAEAIIVPAPRLTIGDGFLQAMEVEGRISKGVIELNVMVAFGPFLYRLVKPFPEGESFDPGSWEDILVDAQEDAIAQALMGYFLAHKKSTNPTAGTDCDFLKLTIDTAPGAAEASYGCAFIVGMRMAKTDGNDVNAGKLVDYVLANFAGIYSGDESLCPSPQKCGDIAVDIAQDIFPKN